MAEEADDLAHLSLEAKALDGAQGGRQSRRGGKGKGRGGHRGGGGDRNVQISKAMSKLLRHQAQMAGISLDDEGYAPLAKVVTMEDVERIVSESDKQRFSLKPAKSTPEGVSDTPISTKEPSGYLIRANQGHSIKLDSAAHLTPLTIEAGNIPPRVIHGTYFAFWPLIESSGGLKPMSRNHVHCATGLPESGEGVVSGMRGDAEVVVEIDVEGSIKGDDVKWWMSDNGVVLTEGGESGLVSTRWFKKVEGRKLDVGVLWENGQRVGDLPQGIKGRVPRGKGPRGGGGSGRGASSGQA